MPNWVYNNLWVGGKTEDVAKFMEKARQPRPEGLDENNNLVYDAEPQALSFFNFIAPPMDAITSGEYFGTHGYEGGKTLGHTEFNWYEFQTREWGTKWDASDIDVDELEENSTGVSYRFQTAWSPPMPVFHAMVKQHPELTFEVEWEEEQGFGEELETEDTEEGRVLTITRSWDIPDCHNDYVERDNEDGCRCAWTDDPHDWYDDCSDLKESMETWHSENECEDSDCEYARNGSGEEPNLVY